MFNTDATRPRYNETIGTDVNGNPITPNDVLNKYFDDIVLCTLGEPWRYVGEDNQPDFEGTWDNRSTGSVSASFRRVGNTVKIRGLVDMPSPIAVGSTIFTLPEGYRPLKNHLYSAPSASSNQTRLLVRSDGIVTTAGTVGSYVSMICEFDID